MKNEVKHTVHSSYRCEYHSVFAPKYRRKVIYKELRRDIIEIIKKLCKEMKVEIIEGEACPDHIHLLVSIPLYMSNSTVCGEAQEQKCADDFRQARKLEIQIREQKFLVSGILCGYGREKRKKDPGIYPKPVGRRSGNGSDHAQRIHGPVYG